MSKQSKKEEQKIERNLIDAKDAKLKGMEKALFSDSERVEYWFSKNWKKATAVLVIIALLIVVTVFVVSKFNSGSKAAADSLADVTIETKDVIAKNNGNAAAPAARFRLAGQYIAKKDYKNALPLLRQVAGDSKVDAVMRKQAQIALVSALEAAGDVAGATAQSVKIAKDRSLDLTLRLANGSNAARLMAASGKKADAVALIKDMLKEDNGKNSAAFANLRQQLNLLESKTK